MTGGDAIVIRVVGWAISGRRSEGGACGAACMTQAAHVDFPRFVLMSFCRMTEVISARTAVVLATGHKRVCLYNVVGLRERERA